MIALLLALTGLAQGACTVISGAEVHLSAGPQPTSIVVVDDRIEAVGVRLDGLRLTLNAQAQVSGAKWKGGDCTFIQGAGKVVTPGLVEVSSQLGLVEVGLENSTRDNDGGGDEIRAALQVANAYNPRSSLIPIQRVAGITSAMVVPTGGFISGQAGWVQLTGERQSESVVDVSAAMYMSIRHGSSRANAILRLNELFDDVAYYRTNRTAFEQNRARAVAASRLDLEALDAVHRGHQPLVVRAERAADIEALLRVVASTPIRLVISGAAEGWIMADELAQANVPVILDPLVYGPHGFDKLHGRRDNAALLSEAGVMVILSTFSSHNARTLRQVAGNAVREGMDHTAAVNAITLAPATVFGQSDRGRLEAGAVADLVVWTGDPLEISSYVSTLMIGGEQIELKTRQTELRDAYRTLPGSPLAPLSLE